MTESSSGPQQIPHTGQNSEEEQPVQEDAHPQPQGASVYGDQGQGVPFQQSQPPIDESYRYTGADNTYGVPHPAGGYPGANQPPSYSQTMGYSSSAPVARPQAPQAVKWAVYIMYAVIALGIVSRVVQLIDPEQSITNQLAGAFNITDETHQELVAEQTMLSAVAGSIFSLFRYAAYAVFAVCAQKGAQWARIVLTVIFGLIALNILSVFLLLVIGFNILILLAMFTSLLSIAGIVFLWLEPSNNFYQEMKAYNQWKTYSMYRK